MRLVCSLLVVAALSAPLVGALAWYWTGQRGHLLTGAVVGVVLLLLSGALASEGKRRALREEGRRG